MKRNLLTWRTATVALMALGVGLATGRTSAQVAEQVSALGSASPAEAAPAGPLVDQYVTQTAAQAPPLVESYDPAVTTGGIYGPELEHEGHAPIRGSQPINWISGPYIKSGVSMPFGGGILGGSDAGYTINFGFRQPLSPALDERLFFDAGGSYLSAFGNEARITPGTQTLNDVTTDIDITSTLEEVQRGGVHTALGWYWGEPIDLRSNDPQLRIATRLGGRLSHFRGHFDDTPVIAPPNGAVVAVLHGKTDTGGGLFVGTEAMLLNRDWAGGSVQWTLDIEVGNDWVTFDDFGSGNLATASVMLGWMFSR